jgi:hypothetical protein
MSVRILNMLARMSSTRDARGQARSSLDGARRALLEQLQGLSEETLSNDIVFGDWTIKDLLAHIAFWDRWELKQMRRMLRGGAPPRLTGKSINQLNAEAVARWRSRSVGEVLKELDDARSAWVAWLRRLSDEQFLADRTFSGQNWSFSNCIDVQLRHDSEHVQQIAAWRATRERHRQVSKSPDQAQRDVGSASAHTSRPRARSWRAHQACLTAPRAR